MQSQLVSLWMLLLCLVAGGCNHPAPPPAPPVVQPAPGPVVVKPQPPPQPVPASIGLLYQQQHNLLLIASQPAPGQQTGTATLSVVDPATGKTLMSVEGSYPSWTPDGRIIFILGKNGAPQIWVMNSDGTSQQLVLDKPAIMPQLGKNGRLAFMAPGSAGDEIWVMDPAGARKLAMGSAPNLALSGTWLVFTRAVNGHNEIFKINADGSGETQLTFVDRNTDSNNPDANAAAISPDESLIAIYTGKESTGPDQDPSTWGYRNVAVIPAAGGPRKIVTPCLPIQQHPTICAAADNPAWTPDGQYLVFDTTDPGVWIVDPNGQGFAKFYATSRGPSRVPLKAR